MTFWYILSHRWCFYAIFLRISQISISASVGQICTFFFIFFFFAHNASYEKELCLNFGFDNSIDVTILCLVKEIPIGSTINGFTLESVDLPYYQLHSCSFHNSFNHISCNSSFQTSILSMDFIMDYYLSIFAVSIIALLLYGSAPNIVFKINN